MAAPDRESHFDDHTGRWTEDDFFALPIDQRVELVDGSLVVSPTSAHRHQWLALGLCGVLNAAAPAGVRALGPVNVRLGADRILIPDVAVVRGPRRTALASEAADALLVIEIVNPGNAAMDRVFKPQLYAQAGIERYLRVELEEQAPVGHLGFLDGETYQQVAHGAVIELDRPFPVTLDLPALDDLDD